ncbi:hypothetical protein BDF19DRAFT_415375 [Syncephalis fuscata]|nr:hypothetical protein BDF19DRAFT_415375 [Syncephalis fuscata]
MASILWRAAAKQLQAGVIRCNNAQFLQRGNLSLSFIARTTVTNTMTTAKKTAPTAPAPERPPRDEEITAPFIEVVEENGELKPGGPWKTRDVLHTLDREQYFILEVDSTANPPVCRIYSKKERYEKQRLMKERKRALASTRVSKQLIVGDNVQPHDMEHKLKKARQMLSKGYRVTLSVETRPGGNEQRQSRGELVKKRTAVLTHMIQQLRDVTSVAQNIGILAKSTAKTTSAKNIDE